MPLSKEEESKVKEMSAHLKQFKKGTKTPSPSLSKYQPTAEKVFETPQEIAGKINSLPAGSIRSDVIQGLPEKLEMKDVVDGIKNLKGNDRIDISHIRNGETLAMLAQKFANGGFNMNDQRWHGGGAPAASQVVSINSDSTSAQFLTEGTSGNDFNIADDGLGTHTFNIPTASATKRGALSSADWSTFNNKGDVVGPASSTDNAIARYDGTTGKLLQNSSVLISDAGAVSGVTTVNGYYPAYSGADITVGSANCDYTDIQSALDAVPTGGATIYVSDGTYTIITPLLFKKSSTTLILSAGAVVQANMGLAAFSTSGMIRVNATDGSIARCRWTGGKMENTSGTQGVAIDLDNTTLCYYDHITISGFATAIRMVDSTNITFYNACEDIRILLCTNGVNVGGTLANWNYFKNIRCSIVVGGGGTCLDITNARGLTFEHCDWENSTATGLTGAHIEGTCRGITFINNWFENNEFNVVIDSGAESTTFVRCTIHNETGTGTPLTDNGIDTMLLNTSISDSTGGEKTNSKWRSISVYKINKLGSTYYGFNTSTGYTKQSTSLDTVWTDMMTTISTNPAIIEFGVGTFTTVTGLSFEKSNITVRGQGIGATIITADSSTGADSTSVFECDPTQSATAYPLLLDANAGDLVLTISSLDLLASGIDAGDYILLYSSLSIDTEFTGRNQGELHKVISVSPFTGEITIGTTNDGTHIYQTMTTANTAKVVKLTMYTNINIRGITFTDAAASRPTTFNAGAVVFRFVDNLSITNCQVRDAYNTGFFIGQCMNVRINDCHLKNMKDVTPSSNVFYGIAAKGATINMSVQNCSFDNMRHGFVQGAGNATYYAGTTRNVSVSGCTSVSTYASHFDCHQGCEGLSFVNNTMVGDDGAANGIQTRSPATITGNSIIGVLGKGISLFGNAHGSVISGNYIKGCTDGVYVDRGVNKPVIDGNMITGGTRGGQFSRYSASVTISNASPGVVSYADHNLTAGAQVTFTTVNTLPIEITAGTVYYVIATGISKDSFQISATEGGSAINTSGGSGTHTIAVRSGNDAILSNNIIWGNSSYGFGMNGQKDVVVSGNKFLLNTLPFQIANTDSTADSWMITDNFSSRNSSTNLPTLLGTNHQIRGNIGFNSFNYGYLAITALRTLDVTDHVVNCTSGTFTVTLPTAVGIKGREYVIKNSGTGVITIDGAGTETIDGALTQTLPAQYDFYKVTSDGANWIITG